jgi:photosystem II stability/assembly factor-like uncharacterized protein
MLRAGIPGLVLLPLLVGGACHNSSGTGGPDGGGAGGVSAPGTGGTGVAPATGGVSGSGGSSGTTLVPDPCIQAGTCTPGVWTDVTPAGMDPSDLAPADQSYGPGSVVRDPARPSDFYVGGSASGLWKSTDYGLNWTKIAGTDDVPDAPRGVLIAVAGTTPATIWAAGYNEIHKSTDGGATWTRTPLSVSLYSLQVDPHDATHLVSGLHEADGVYESKDGGATWTNVSGAGFPSGGVSWYPFFIDTGNAATTRTTWFAIAQNGASAIMTSDAGAHWRIPSGISGLNHAHGNAQIFQSGATLFVGGVGGPGQGVYRSTDLGQNWSLVDGGARPQAIVWGSATRVYSMYAWACSLCDLGTNWESAPLPDGTTWTAQTTPAALNLGPNSIATSFDGDHYVFVGVMWSLGVWRYVEPS